MSNSNNQYTSATNKGSIKECMAEDRMKNTFILLGSDVYIPYSEVVLEALTSSYILESAYNVDYDSLLIITSRRPSVKVMNKDVITPKYATPEAVAKHNKAQLNRMEADLEQLQKDIELAREAVA